MFQKLIFTNKKELYNSNTKLILLHKKGTNVRGILIFADFQPIGRGQLLWIAR